MVPPTRLYRIEKLPDVGILQATVRGAMKCSGELAQCVDVGQCFLFDGRGLKGNDATSGKEVVQACLAGLQLVERDGRHPRMIERTARVVAAGRGVGDEGHDFGVLRGCGQETIQDAWGQ